MSTFNKEYDGLADAIITNAIVMPAVELKEGEKFPPFIIRTMQHGTPEHSFPLFRPGWWKH